jgi:Trk-type K+ transport system membrane component
MTGGLAVQPDSLASAPPLAQWLAAGFLLLGGANVAVLLVALAPGRRRRAASPAARAP